MNKNKVNLTLVAQNSVLNLLSNAVPILSGLISIPVIVRKLGPEQFGILSLSWAVLGYFTLLEMGMGRATTRFVSEAIAKEQENRIAGIIWTGMWVQTSLGVGSMILLWILTPYFTSLLNISQPLIALAHETFFYVALSIPAALISIQLRGALEGSQRFGIVNSVQAFYNSALFLVPLFGVLIGLSLPWMVALVFLTRVLIVLIYLTFCLKTFPVLRSWPLPMRNSLEGLLKYGGWVMGTNISTLILLQVDRFLIGTFGSMSEVTFYTIPYEMVTRLFVIPGAIMAVVFPAVSVMEASGAHDRLEFLFHRTLKYILLMMGILITTVTIFSKNIITLWMGESVAIQSSPVFQILAIGVWATSLAYIPLSFLQAIGRSRITAQIRIWQIPPTILLIIVAVEHWGIMGAAYVWLIRALIDLLLFFVIFYKLSWVSPRMLLQTGVAKVAFLLITFSLLATSIRSLVESALIQVIMVTCMIILSIGYFYFYIMDDQDVKNLRHFFHLRFLKKHRGTKL